VIEKTLKTLSNHNTTQHHVRKIKVFRTYQYETPTGESKDEELLLLLTFLQQSVEVKVKAK